MADASYQSATYKRQGGGVTVIASTGTLLVESGGGIELDSGAQLRLEDGASLTVPVVTETTSAALSNFGISSVTKGTTATGANSYTMDAPAAGVVKHIVALAANTSEHIIVGGNTNVTYDPAGTKDKLKIVAPGMYQLVGLSTSAWGLVACSTTLAFATS